MKISTVLALTFFVLIVLVSESCKKTEEDDYLICGECSNAEISGDYTGNGKYFTDNKPDLTENVDVKLNLNNIENNLFEAKVEVLDKFSKTYFVTKQEGSAALTISGTNESINLTIYRKSGEYKINGTAKVYHTQADTLFLEHSVSFTVFK